MKKYLSVILALCMLLSGGLFALPQNAMAAVAKPQATTISSVKGEANGFTVKWTKVAETTGYQVQYSTKSNFSNAATVYGGATNTTSKTITGRVANTKYYVRVRTYKNVKGAYTWGNWSASKAITTPAKPKTTAISSVAGVANGFTVKWSKVADTTGYQIQYSTRSNFSGAATVYGGATNTTSKTITGRAANTKYYVRVRTYKNISGNYLWGNWSAAKAVTTKSNAPSATAIIAATGVRNGFTINWKKVAETTGYQIQYSTKSNFSNAATVYGGATNTTSKTITGRADNTTYYVRVRTYKNISGNYIWGAWSSAVSVKTLPKASAVDQVKSYIKSKGIPLKASLTTSNADYWCSFEMNSYAVSNAKTTINNWIAEQNQGYYKYTGAHCYSDGKYLYLLASKERTTKKDVTAKSVQDQVNAYIRSKGITVDSSLNSSNSGWSGRIAGEQDDLNSGYSLKTCKSYVDMEIASMGNNISLYCYYSNGTFYICYM